MTPAELYDSLSRLSDEQLDELCSDLPKEALNRLPDRPTRDERVQLFVKLIGQWPELEARLAARLADPVPQWLESHAAEYRLVRVIGFQDRYKIRIPLDEVFVPLALRPRRRGEVLKGGGHAEREAFHADEPREVRLEGALELSQTLPNTAGIVILGDPGAGKTTLLKYLYARVAREGSAKVGLPPGLCPVYIRCAGIDEGDLKPFGLKQAIAREAERSGHPEAGRRLVADRRPVLFLLDGLDEVRDRSMRGRVCDWLGEEVARWPGSRFVATCRFAAFQEEARLDNQFLRVDVHWLDEPRVREYVRRWFRAVEEGLAGPGEAKRAAAQAAEKAETLLRAVLDPERQRHVRLREMTENPLLLSTLCLVHHSDLRLPDKRGELYDRCISLLLETWTAHAGRPTLPDRPTRLVLQPLAHAMHERRVKDLPAEEVESLVAGPLGQVPAIKMSTREFLEIARDQCGVLASRDLGSYEFFHLSFQEYLCAAHIKEHGLAAALAERASDPWWKEVVLLAVSMPGVLGPFLRALIESGRLGEHREFVRACLDETIQMDEAPFVEVLDREIARLERPQRGLGAWWRRLTASGEPGVAPTVRAVLELSPGKALPGVVQRAERLLSHPDSGVSAAARAIVREPAVQQVTAPARAGSVLREPITDMSFVWVLPGLFWMGSSRTPGERGFDPEAHETETPAREVKLPDGRWMGEHPVTNACYGAFLIETKRTAPPYWQERRFNAPEQPVVGVSFEDALAFCAWLTDRAGLPDGFRFDLPTEAEWEHAARGNDGRRYPWGNEPPTADRAWFGQDWEKGAPPVSRRPAGSSPWGCQDMAGNVWEWCLDAWSERYVPIMPPCINPCHHGDRGAPRVIRGGSWHSEPRSLRCATRLWYGPRSRDVDLGFRVVCRGSHQPFWLTEH